MASFDPDPVLPEAARLADRFRALDYTVDAVAARLGPVAGAALARSQTTPARLALAADTSPLATLIQLWLLQAPVPTARLETALPGLVGPLRAAGVVRVDGDTARAAVDIRPYGDERHDWWVVCDLLHSMDGRTDPVPGDHVPGVGGATTSLAQLTVRDPVEAALDLGTGCGVQALHLSSHARRVVGTDINPRALAMARLATALTASAGTATPAAAIDYRLGDFFAPVVGQRFDLVVANPPFVISPKPRSGELLAYRDAGLAGDGLGAMLLAGLPEHLTPNGTAALLANWEHRAALDWQQRVTGWAQPLLAAGADVWVLQREVLDPAAYAETWLRDAGHHRAPDYPDRYAAWLADFAGRGVTGIGFGWISARMGGAAGRGRLRIEDHPGPVAQPVAPAVAGWFTGARWLAGPRARDAHILAATLRMAPGLDEERYAEPGAGDPRAVILRQHTGLLRAAAVDSALAGLVGACDGTLSIGSIIDALAQLLEVSPADLQADLLPRVRTLIEQGYLLPPG